MLSRTQISLLFFLISFLAFSLIELLAPDALVYVVGGIIGTPIFAFLKLFFTSIPPLWFMLIWSLITVFMAFIFLRSRHYYSSAFLLMICALLLTEIDVAQSFGWIMDYDWSEASPLTSFVSGYFAPLIKSALLAFLLYLKLNSINRREALVSSDK